MKITLPFSSFDIRFTARLRTLFGAVCGVLRFSSGFAAAVKIVAFALLIPLFSCGEEIDTPEAMLPWLGDPENGLVQEHSGKPVLWRVKYLPNDYLAWRYLQSLERYDKAARDSVIQSYSNTICFLLTVAPGEKKGGDVMTQGVGSFEDFQSRAMQLNFDVKDLVTLRYGGIETPAVISTMENTYGLNEGRDIMVIFARDSARWSSADTLDVVLDDRIFNSGIHHFTFLAEDIRNIPEPEIPLSNKTE